MTMPKRSYSQKTLKVLFALSGNQCAHPECTNTLIEPATEKSDSLVTAQICHIYAISEDGPRGKSGLTEGELNSPENLILLCPTHHAIIDGQHETYPAELLKQWKNTHEMEVKKRLSTDLDSIQPDVFSHPYFPRELVDQKIENEVDLIRKSRFFIEFERAHSSLVLAQKIVEGELSGGSDAVRSRALSLCARFMFSFPEGLDEAEKYLKFAKGLGTCPEIRIADAFICSYKGDKAAALSNLAIIDMPASRSAALMIVAHHDGSQGAIDWLKTTGIDATDLDPEGKFFLLQRQLELARWEAARECLDVLTDDELREAPALIHMVAFIHLIGTVPIELRTSILIQLPFESANFPLASDSASIDERRIAQRHFVMAAEVAQQLNCPKAATIFDEYALWLELRDPDESEKGRQRLEAKLRDPRSALRLVQLGLQFGIILDLVAVEREIERQIALHGAITFDAAIARFALAFTQKSPEDIASYISQHCDELTKFFDKKSLQTLQIEMLLRAGQLVRANECLDILVGELSELEESRLRRKIAEAEGTDPVEDLKELFKKTDSLIDLARLVEELETKKDWNGICEYGQILFGRTHSLPDAEQLAVALNNAQENERLVNFLKSNSDLLTRSKNLQLLYCWALYHEGALLEARSQLVKLSDDQDNPNYRALQVSLGIALGDWSSLSAFVANECLEKEKRSAQDLIRAAQLALHLGSPHAKELIFTAASKGKDDPGVLAVAYTLASNGGWEDNPDVFQWLQAAATLSGDDGPIQKKTMKDILDLKPEWDRRTSETWQQLSQGKIPMYFAAQFLNKSLIELMLFPAFANLSEIDPRRRSAVPAYSGKRQPTMLENRSSVGIDVTSLLTLSYLNLLDKALDAFDTVHVPHSTLAWLFEEKQKVRFHQKSRIRDAHFLRNLLATDTLEKFLPSTVPDSDLSAQVGEELALLIAEAEKESGKGDRQRIVVRSSPVPRLGTLMMEEADLVSHASVLSNCQSIVDKLRKNGYITSDEEKKARAFLQLHEKPWPHQPEITDGAILYLDDVTIVYFIHLGILDRLQAAGFRAFISPYRVSEIKELIFYENTYDKVNNAIERIRPAIKSRIESGKINVGRLNIKDEHELQSMARHPTIGLVALIDDCNAIITDDRFLNQHKKIKYGNSEAPTFSTLELLDALVSIGSITPEDWLEYRTLLRRAGYFFVPVTDDELKYHLNASMIEDSKFTETAELKAIRENILCVRMSNWLQVPEEAYWINRLLNTFIDVLKDLWITNTDFSGVRTRSDWIMNLIDVHGWTHSLGGENGDKIVMNRYVAYIMMLLSPPRDVPQEVKDEYWRWVEDSVLIPIKERDPNVYYRIVECYRRRIAETADLDLSEGELK